MVELGSGLELKLLDASRVIAGDRWQVCLIARIDIPLEGDCIPWNEINPDEFADFQTSVGRLVRFEKKLVRNFIDDKAKEPVLNLMLETFIEDSLAYLSHRDFSRKFVLRRFNEFRKLKTRGG